MPVAPLLRFAVLDKRRPNESSETGLVPDLDRIMQHHSTTQVLGRQIKPLLSIDRQGRFRSHLTVLEDRDDAAWAVALDMVGALALESLGYAGAPPAGEALRALNLGSLPPSGSSRPYQDCMTFVDSVIANPICNTPIRGLDKRVREQVRKIADQLATARLSPFALPSPLFPASWPFLDLSQQADESDLIIHFGAIVTP